MRGFGLIVSAFIAALLFIGSVAAASPHFVGRGPTFVDQGTVLNASGSVAGLGNENLTVVLTADGVASVVCINPGGNRAPGQDTNVTTTGTVEDIEVKNGRAFFDVTTAAPTVTGAEACPNPQWTAIVTDVAFTSATLTFFQGGEEVLQETFPV
jgi:hypothetical protein